MTLRYELRFLCLDIEPRVEALSKVLTQSCVKIKIKLHQQTRFEEVFRKHISAATRRKH